MKLRNLLPTAILITLAGCSSTETYQYVWYKAGVAPDAVRRASATCGNTIGENTLSTTQRQEAFHHCMKEKGYTLKKSKNTN